MKKLNVFLVSVLATAALNAAVIEQVIVRQQWPWSTDVKIEYKISAVTNPVDIAIQAYNGASELSLPEAAITGDRYGISEDGVGTLVIDPVAAFGTEKVALANFKVKLTVSDSAANIREPLYRICDLTNGEVKDLSRADIMNDRSYGNYVTNYAAIHPGFTTGATDVFIWTGVTNNPAFKTTKLVLRRIPAKNAVFPYGAPANPVNCTLTNDYWMGVFDLTYEQYKTMSGSYEGSYLHLDGFEMMPISGLAFKDYNNKVVPFLRLKVPSLAFDFPTEARLTFAIRGGKHDDSNGWHGATEKGLVAWYSENSTVTSGKQPHVVGTKLPNAYGLYDAIGNVDQLTKDKTTGGALPTEDVVEPILDNGGSWNTRGGQFNGKYPGTEFRDVCITYSASEPVVGYRPYVDNQ